MKTKIAVWLMIVSACSILLADTGKVPVRTFLPPGFANAAPLLPNGDFVISVERLGRWQEVGRLSGDRFLREQRLDLAPWLQNAKKARVRIRQAGGGASHLDAVLLGGGAPLSAPGGMTDKISRRDNDLATATGRTVELTFAVPAGGDRSLAVTGRIENKVIPSEPFQFPVQNTFRAPSPHSSFYSYRLGSAAPPPRRFAGAAWLAEVGGRQPFFAALSPTGTGHPTGTTYGWVSNDERNLYVTIDFTPDNTYDGDKDYAKVYVRGDGQVREFKVSVPEKRWGRAHFVYTDKVVYQHKVYDFAIPLAGLPRNGAGGLDVSFAAYGTASPMIDIELDLAYDPNLRRYLLVMAGPGSSSTDILGVFIDEDGNIIGSPFPITMSASDDERHPKVAYDRINRRFMVTWHQVTSDDTEHVLGQIFRDDGIPYTLVIHIMSSSDFLYSPTLAFDEVNQRYLVAWIRSDDNSYSWAFGQLRDSAGFLVGPLEFNISPSGTIAGNVDLAFDTQSQLYMVVWDDQGSIIAGPSIAALPEANNIAGQMVAAGGTLVGGPFAVSTGEYACFLPAVTNDTVNHRFLAAWIQLPDIDNVNPATIEQRRERFHARAQARYTAAYPASSPIIAGQLFDNLGAASGGTLGIGLNPAGQPLWPRLAHDPVHGRYLAVWNNMTPPVFPNPPVTSLVGQFLDNNGNAIGTDPAENFEIGSNAFFFNPAPLACNTVCGNFLTIWLSESDSGGIEVIGGGCPTLPTVETLPVSSIGTTMAAGGGNVTGDGGANVFSRGVCWNTTGNPTLADTHSSDGNGLGIFSSLLNGLLPATTYHVRAYATNSVGTFYGDEVVFTTFRWVVIFVADAGGTLVGPTPQYLNSGGSCLPVEAVAKTGYFFRRWEGINSFSSLVNPLTVTNVLSDLTFHARIGSLGLSVNRRVEQAWIIKSEYADVEIEVGGLADSGAAKFLLMRKAEGGDWELQKEILPGDLSDGHYSFASLPLEKDKQYSFRVEARSASGALLGVSAEVTI
jgi:hypothetical protein